MIDAVTLRTAIDREAEMLSGLALRSKAYWGYTNEFIESCKDELSYEPEQIDDDQYRFVVAQVNSDIAGFYALEQLSADDYELAALFVEPRFIGKGVGRTLMQHAIRSVAEKNGTSVLIQGDPNVEKFYRAAGAEKIGERESGSVPGRFLPLFKIRIPQATKDSPEYARSDL